MVEWRTENLLSESSEVGRLRELTRGEPSGFFIEVLEQQFRNSVLLATLVVRMASLVHRLDIGAITRELFEGQSRSTGNGLGLMFLHELPSSSGSLPAVDLGERDDQRVERVGASLGTR